MNFKAHPRAASLNGPGASARFTADPGSSSGAIAPRRAREPLKPEGLLLLSQVAKQAPLARTGAQFPHVVNRLAVVWPNLGAMVVAIDNLLIDDRPNREGFPFPVRDELVALREFCAQGF